MFFEKIKRIMEVTNQILEMLGPIACTGGGKCPLRFFCEHFCNHEEQKTKSYVMAEFDSEKGMCKNYKQLK